MDDDGACGDPECCGAPYYWIAIKPEDGRLISASPDSHAANVAMVDALNVAFGIKSEHDDEYIYDTLPTSGVANAYFAARAAIAKARGEQP